MNIEESVRSNSEKFQAVLDLKEDAIREALDDLSEKLDIIFNGAIMEYCDAEGCEAKIEEISNYKTLNRMITGKIDELVKAHIEVKRKDIV